SREFLTNHFGKQGHHFYDVVRGVHLSPVKPHRIPKSLSAENTFSENISSEIFMVERLKSIAQSVEKRLHKNHLTGKTVTLKIKYSEFTIQTRSKTLPYFIAHKELILETAKSILYQEEMQNSVRLLGISVSTLNTEKITPGKKENEIYVQLKFKF